MIRALNPKILTSEDSSYKTVKELNEVIEEALKKGEINMAKKEERFEVTFRDGSQLKDEGVRQILVDKETGVNYLCWKSGYGAGITPLLDSEGKVIVTK